MLTGGDSWIHPINPPNTHTLSIDHPVADAYVKKEFNMMKGRDLDIVCTLRGSNHDPTRLRVRSVCPWVEEYA